MTSTTIHPLPIYTVRFRSGVVLGNQHFTPADIKAAGNVIILPVIRIERYFDEPLPTIWPRLGRRKKKTSAAKVIAASGLGS